MAGAALPARAACSPPAPPSPALQSLLQAVGVGAKRSLPAAATINWVLKDGLGRLGRLTVATRFGESFDSDLKVCLHPAGCRAGQAGCCWRGWAGAGRRRGVICMRTARTTGRLLCLLDSGFALRSGRRACWGTGVACKGGEGGIRGRLNRVCGPPPAGLPAAFPLHHQRHLRCQPQVMGVGSVHAMLWPSSTRSRAGSKGITRQPPTELGRP